MLGRGTVFKINPDRCSGIRHNHQVAAGPKRRIEDRAKRCLHQIGVRPTNPLVSPRINLPGGKSLTAYMAGNVTGADEDQFLAQHGAPPLYSKRSLAWNWST